MPKSLRHQFAARAAASLGPSRREYEITDPHFRPDMRGEFGGVKVEKRAGKWYVRFSAAQARYWIDQGVLKAA